MRWIGLIAFLMLSCVASASVNFIDSWTDLKNMPTSSTSTNYLLVDLNSSSADYTGIGNDWHPIPSFSGVFDGLGRSIENMISHAVWWPGSCVGFIHQNDGTIKRVGFINCGIYGNPYPGQYQGIMTGINNGTISDCYVYSANVIQFHTGLYSGGGLIAGLNNGMIKQCYAVGRLVFGSESSLDFGSGGLVGRHDRTAGAVMMSCWACVNSPLMPHYGFGGAIGTICWDGSDYGVYGLGWVNSPSNDTYAVGLHTVGLCGTKPTRWAIATYETGTITTFCDPSHSIYTLTSPWLSLIHI